MLLLSDFDYDLPEERIAQTPIEPRNASRLMVLDPVEKTIDHRHFYDLKESLEPGDTLIFNDTRVMPARLIGHRDQTGGKVEVFLLRRIDGTHWETLVKPGKKAKPGNVICFSDELSCEVTDHTDFGGRIVEFRFDGIFEEILDRLGKRPCRRISMNGWKTKSAIKRSITVKKALPQRQRLVCILPKSRCRSSRTAASIWDLSLCM